MTLTEIANYRVINQQVAGTSLLSATNVVQWLGAVQAQEFAQAKWALGLRLSDKTDELIEKEFTEGEIIRTHILRPTWHFVAANDLRWMLALSAPRVQAVNAYMYRQLELDETLFRRCNNLITRSLEGGRQLSRNTINEEFAKKGIAAEGHRLSYIMMNAELEGLVCSGARDGKQFTYALMDERVPGGIKLEREEALAELTKRYFSSRGPATVHDFSTWSGLAMSDCRRGLAMNGTSFERIEVEGVKYYFSPKTEADLTQSSDIILLPIYDELLMGYKDRRPLMEWKNMVNSTALFRYDGMIVSGSQIIGTWKRTVQSSFLEMKADFFRPPNKKQERAFLRAIARMEVFTGMTVKLVS